MVLAKKRTKCALRMVEALERLSASTMPAEIDARERLIALCAVCPRCVTMPTDITGGTRQR